MNKQNEKRDVFLECPLKKYSRERSVQCNIDDIETLFTVFTFYHWLSIFLFRTFFIHKTVRII